MEYCLKLNFIKHTTQKIFSSTNNRATHSKMREINHQQSEFFDYAFYFFFVVRTIFAVFMKEIQEGWEKNKKR